MKKIAIITLYGEFNFGNRLQNYAICRVFEKWGVSADTLVKKPSLSFIKRLVSYSKSLYKTAYSIINKEKKTIALRKEAFKNFTKKYIPTIYFSGNIDRNMIASYDLFVIGSDQVWNPCFMNYEAQFNEMFLIDVPFYKKACFAPSFGVSYIPEIWREDFCRGLKSFPRLCVREDTGAEIIKELTGKDAYIMIDPTLMLDEADWKKIISPVKDLNGHYRLDYFLGEIPSDDEYYSKQTKDYTTNRVNVFNVTKREIYKSGPSEFLYLISNADLICTDSFHACVFSILFNKPFVIFKRHDQEKDMFSRIENLLKLFEISPVDIKNGDIIQVDVRIRDEILKIKRQEVYEYFSHFFEEKRSFSNDSVQ